MSNLQHAIFELKESMIDMAHLVRSQLLLSRQAYLDFDTDIAKTIVDNEKRVNDMELANDQLCENIIALYNPVAIDLRFVIAMLKSNTDLERMGDNVEGIAKYIIGMDKPFEKQYIEAFESQKMFDLCIEMFDTAIEAFVLENTHVAANLFKQDRQLDELNKHATQIAPGLLANDRGSGKEILASVSIIRKLERIGDQVTNLAEEIIFYLDAKVLKHLKRKKKFL